MAKRSTIETTATLSAVQFAAEGHSLSCRIDVLNHDIVARLAIHGLTQKIKDAAAIPVNPETGRSASMEEKFAAMRAVVTALQAGEWSRRGEGDGTSGGGLLLSALLRFYADSRTEKQVLARYKALSDKEPAALRANPKISAIIAEIKAERAAKAADGATGSDDLLDSF